MLKSSFRHFFIVLLFIFWYFFFICVTLNTLLERITLLKRMAKAPLWKCRVNSTFNINKSHKFTLSKIHRGKEELRTWIRQWSFTDMNGKTNKQKQTKTKKAKTGRKTGSAICCLLYCVDRKLNYYIINYTLVCCRTLYYIFVMIVWLIKTNSADLFFFFFFFFPMGFHMPPEELPLLSLSHEPLHKISVLSFLQ